MVEDENGNVVRETMKDNDVLVLYKVNAAASPPRRLRRPLAPCPRSRPLVCVHIAHARHASSPAGPYDVPSSFPPNGSRSPCPCFSSQRCFSAWQTMRETLIYLSHLDRDDTERLMLDKLALQARARARE